MHKFEQEREDLNFERRASFAVAAVRAGLNHVIQALEVVNRSFTTFAPVSPEQFHDFTQPLLERYPYIQAFSYQRRIPAAERPRFEAEMRKRFPDFRITEVVDGKLVTARAKDRYRVVEYIEPRAGNEVALGLDASSRAYQEAAMQRAIDTGLPSATELQRLVQGEDQSPGFLIMMPVYRQGAALSTIQAMRQAVVGYTVVVLRAREFIEKILDPVEAQFFPALDISVYASYPPSEEDLAFRTGKAPILNKSTSPLSYRLFHDMPPNFSKTLDVAGTPWHIVVSPRKSAFIDNHLGSVLAGIVGMLLSLAGALYIQNVSLRSQRIQRLVEERTAELKRSNERLTEDIAVRERVEEALQESRTLLRRLAAHQERIKEDERKRIAREIHDDLGQNLLALRIDVSMLHARTRTLTLVNEKIGAALNQIDRTMKSVRNIINNLRPSVLDLGLHAAIEWQAKEFELRSGISCQLKIDHDEFEMDDSRATALFRIVQESLTNVHRHAKASRVWITMRKESGRLFLEISDNGVGFSPDHRKKDTSFGLVGIEERIKAFNGTFSIGRGPGHGVSLTISIPISAKPPIEAQPAIQD